MSSRRSSGSRRLDVSFETVATWLQSHPGIEIVTRDRSTEYARGITQGAPDAIQMADRWHVLGNLREVLERMLDRLRPGSDLI